LQSGSLRVGADCPYNKPGGEGFRIVLQRDANGRWLPKLAGFEFDGAFYAKQ
jgi:hypothetical protein